MKIGKALRIERLNLKLTQEQMCKGIVSHPFYAKVESGKNRINAESLFEILASHHMNFDCKIKAHRHKSLFPEVDEQVLQRIPENNIVPDRLH